MPFRRGALYHLLANRIYVGEIVHKGTAYPGQHDAIVSRELFDAVQARLAERSSYTSETSPRRVVSLLSGMISDHEGRPMSPAHTQKNSKRYRYYTSNRNDGSTSPAQRLPAEDLDAAVRKALTNTLRDPVRVRAMGTDLGPHQLEKLISHCGELSECIAAMSVAELRDVLKQLDCKLEVSPDGIAATVADAGLIGLAGIEADTLTRSTITIPTITQPYGHEARLRLDPPSGTPKRKDENLLQLIARAFAARDQLLAMSDTDVAAMPIRQRRHIERTARLSFLAPDIVTAILDGTQPKQLTARKLIRLSSLPSAWTEQRRLLALPDTLSPAHS